MARKRTSEDSRRLHFANLALTAEEEGNYEEAAEQWRKASGASLNRGNVILYEEAAKRCEQRSRLGGRATNSDSVSN
jgi:hypothetical protein